METQITKTELLEKIRIEHENLERIIEQLTEDQMTQPGAEANWSVKDILAHITDWERRMRQWVEESVRGETPDRPGPGTEWDGLDRLNEQTYQMNRDRPLDEVLADYYDSYQQSLKAVESLSQEDLTEPDRFEWRGGEPLWPMVAANTFWHYREHGESMRAWLEKGEF